MKEHRQMLECPAPELAWLKKEFHLGDAEFERITKLHDGYMPRCAELCRRIAQKNSELQQLVSGTNVDPKAVEQKLKEAGELRVECQKNMFNHFLEVSRQMPPEQGRRYLQWVQQRTLTPEHDMAERHSTNHTMDRH
jgi:Spy/CpxP family protein refolding chaperone